MRTLEEHALSVIEKGGQAFKAKFPNATRETLQSKFMATVDGQLALRAYHHPLAKRITAADYIDAIHHHNGVVMATKIAKALGA